jgi:hypothetical protein
MDWKKIIRFRKWDFSDYLLIFIVIGMIVLKLFSEAKRKEPVKGDFDYHRHNDHFDSRQHYETEGAGRSIFINR